MPCFYPVTAFRSAVRSAGGGYGITFNPVKALHGTAFSFPCGKCIGCRIDYSRQWAARCLHEAQMHRDNCFLTLTFDDEHLPPDYGVHVEHLQKFHRALRKKLAHRIRFFACGEYGDDGLRPHYHSLIFNHKFTDLAKWSSSKGNLSYTSEALTKLWNYGLATVGELTYQSAAYVARYSMKKIGGNLAAEHYKRVHPLTGAVHQVKPEFVVMSRRPGIGSTWFDKYSADAFPSDFLVIDGKKHPVPRFYLRKLAEGQALEVTQHKEVTQLNIKRRRKAAAIKHRADSTPARLKVREEVLKSRVKLLKRSVR